MAVAIERWRAGRAPGRTSEEVEGRLAGPARPRRATVEAKAGAEGVEGPSLRFPGHDGRVISQSPSGPYQPFSLPEGREKTGGGRKVELAACDSGGESSTGMLHSEHRDTRGGSCAGDARERERERAGADG